MVLNTVWPPPAVGEVDEKDVFGTFGPAEFDRNTALTIGLANDPNPLNEWDSKVDPGLGRISMVGK